eukprot:m.54829 g.54829  ORF g.54829 m.54829 type:complete len:360 (+) comp34408_c0_seq1:98-1177(+)
MQDLTWWSLAAGISVVATATAGALFLAMQRALAPQEPPQGTLFQKEAPEERKKKKTKKTKGVTPMASVPSPDMESVDRPPSGGKKTAGEKQGVGKEGPRKMKKAEPAEKKKAEKGARKSRKRAENGNNGEEAGWTTQVSRKTKREGQKGKPQESKKPKPSADAKEKPNASEQAAQAETEPLTPDTASKKVPAEDTVDSGPVRSASEPETSQSTAAPPSHDVPSTEGRKSPLDVHPPPVASPPKEKSPVERKSPAELSIRSSSGTSESVGDSGEYVEIGMKKTDTGEVEVTVQEPSKSQRKKKKATSPSPAQEGELPKEDSAEPKPQRDKRRKKKKKQQSQENPGQGNGNENDDGWVVVT